MPVVGAAAEFVPAGAGNPEDADLLAAAERLGPERGAAYPSDTEDADADERAVGQCDQRRERGKGPGDREGHSGRRAGRADLGGVARRAHPGEGRRAKQLGDLVVPISLSLRGANRQEEIARSLEGNCQEDRLFVVKQEPEGYEFCPKQSAACDQRLERYLKERADRSEGARLPEEMRKSRRKKKRGNAPQFALRAGLLRRTGVDLPGAMEST
jgi:hypothetical protein